MSVDSQITNTSPIEGLITEHIDIWSSAIKRKSSAGRGSSKKIELYGIKKLRELILELAVRGKLVPQDASDEPASVLLERIAQEKAQLVKEGKIKKPKELPEITEDEKPFELPDGWAWARLGDLAQYQKGYAFKSKDYLDTGVMITKIQNLTDKDTKNSVYITPEKVIGFEEYFIFEGDIVMTTVGSWFSAPISAVGRSFLIDSLFDNSLLNQNAVRIRPYKQINPALLYVNINSSTFKNYLVHEAQGTANQASITQLSIKSYLICIPPREEQHRIVAKVDELMVLCDQLEAQAEFSLDAHQTLVTVLLDTLVNSQNAEELAENWTRISGHFDTLFTTEHSIDQLKQTILQLAVMGKLVEQASREARNSPNYDPASVLLERIAAEKADLIKQGKIKKQKPLPPITEEEKPFELPEGWEWCRLGNLYSFLNGFAFKSEWFKNDGIKLLRNINISHSKTIWNELACVSNSLALEYEKYNLTVGDIVISLDRPIINTGLKYAVIEQSDLPCLLLQRVAKFHSYADSVDSNYLSKWLESSLFISAIDPGRSNGVPHISTKQLEVMLFPLPPLEEQHRIVAKVDELMAICDQLKAQLSEAQTTQLNLADALVEQAL